MKVEDGLARTAMDGILHARPAVRSRSTAY
jgi:hypothetical protein